MAGTDNNDLAKGLAICGLGPMKRVVVTGGTGFIGQHLMEPLRRRGFEIHLIGRRRPLDAKIVFHEADVLDVARMREAIAAANASHLLHLAWDVEPGKYWRSPQNLDWIAASLHLVRNFTEHGGGRTVIAGSCAEYLWGAERFLEEKTPCQPATLYGTSKDALRRILMGYADIAPMSIGWGRIFFLYGPGEKRGRLVSDAIHNLLSRREFPTSHGLQRRDFMHVSDVASAFAALLDCDVRGPVNIGTGEAVSVRSLLETIGRQTNASDFLRFGQRPLPPSEPEVIEADVARLLNEVGFRPHYDLAGGVAETIAWWRRACPAGIILDDA
jgi:nucleoside-diphosphate-sugar epimerase